MNVRDLGLVEYGEGLRIQEETRDKVIEGFPESLIVCEHPDVVTIGRAIGSASEVFPSSIPVFEVSRGGRATLHLPGQVVIYPILDLQGRKLTDLHAYMRKLEDAIVNTLADFRIEAGRIEGKTGVWCSGERKIASLGIAVKKWVSYHGIALNVICDLKKFSTLNPCGFKPDVMTSVERELSDEYRKVWALDKPILLKKVRTRLVENMQEEFQ